ncbi:GNAT family N-acetyltransferase [Paenibacillus sp. S29]
MVSFVSFYFYKMILDVDDLCVDEEYRKRGISQLLLTAAQQHVH